jgi:RNA dependent RNA polymerase
MISVDTRLDGEVVHLRPSMIKFESPDQSEIEICGSASRPLPLRLNRQFIKIMEDLQVEPQGLLDLQNSAVEELRRTTESPLKAADFLERNQVGQNAHLPWLIRKLHAINLSPVKDAFIRDVVEISTLMQLRELKHRSRIPVEQGVTLYGIMDEFDTLKEGEIYCRTDKHVVEGEVAITRAPALHPGDIQFVKAVDVPDDSPLSSLHNCIVFSQRGTRDLPSQLSGGDLDGDLYNVIWDPRLQPQITCPPADYPRVAAVDIGRLVERSDMTEFFIQFMENDQLGRIATLHQQLADLKPMGTQDLECVLLAEMHSTAVDFSKTGIPVDMSRLPKYKAMRPDFMAPGPRYKIEKQGIELIEEEMDDDEEDVITALDPEGTKMRYYESSRILGELYRAIDEHDFLEKLQKQSTSSPIAADTKPTIIDQVWRYVLRQTRLVQWAHQREHVRDIKEA